MKTVVHQALGHIFGHHAAGVFEVAQVQNALVCHMAVGAGVQGGVVRAQAGAHIVGRQYGRLGGLQQAVGAHHAAIHPADR